MANEAALLRVQVCHAAPGSAWRQDLALPPGATVAQALAASGLAQAFPGLDPWQHGVGIFGRLCTAESVLADGDRLEIYRSLTFDPKVSRHRRVAHRRARAAEQGRERPAGLL